MRFPLHHALHKHLQNGGKGDVKSGRSHSEPPGAEHSTNFSHGKVQTSTEHHIFPCLPGARPTCRDALSGEKGFHTQIVGKDTSDFSKQGQMNHLRQPWYKATLVYRRNHY